MARPNRSKKKPPKEISDEESTSIFTFSPPSPSLGLPRTGEKRGHPQSSPEKENQKPVKKLTKLMIITKSIANKPLFSFFLEEHLSCALNSLTKAYNKLEEEEEEEEEEEREELKEQVEQLVYYTRCILLGESPFTQEEEKEKEKEEAKNILKGLTEEVRALYKEVAPTKETYAERLKKDLPSLSSSLPSLLPLPSTPSPFNRSSTSTKNKKKQL